MYAAVRQYEMGAGSLADFMGYVEDELGDTMAALPGFIGYYVIASGEDEIVSVTIFEAERDAVRSSRAAADFVRDRLGPFQVNLTSAMSGEVGVWRSAPAAACCSSTMSPATTPTSRPSIPTGEPTPCDR